MKFPDNLKRQIFDWVSYNNANGVPLTTYENLLRLAGCNSTKTAETVKIWSTEKYHNRWHLSLYSYNTYPLKKQTLQRYSTSDTMTRRSIQRKDDTLTSRFTQHTCGSL